MTNFERIKNMSIEEMTKFLADNSCCDICPNNNILCSTVTACMEGMKKYLESEVK